MTAMEELIEGHYEEVREVPYGKVYKWGLGCTLIECECGELTIAEEDTAICPRCGANYTGVARKLIRASEQEEAYYPEHLEYQGRQEDEKPRREYHERLFSGLFSGLKAKNEINLLLNEFYDD